MALPTIQVLDAAGTARAVAQRNSGRQAQGDSSAVVLSTEDLQALTAIATALGLLGSQTTAAATLAKLNGILAVNVVGGQLGETLWTDDTGAYFVRLDSGGTVTFFGPNGGAAVTPGSGLRPAGDAGFTDRTAYQATAAATGSAVGDLIDHLVAIDRKTGVIVSNTWLNATQATVLSGAPASANITSLGSGSLSYAQYSGYGPMTEATGLLLLAAATATGPLPAPVAATFVTKRGTTHATSGTAAVAAGANPSRRGFMLQNNSVNDMRIDPTGTASATAGILIPGGKNALFEFPYGGVPVTAISIWCAAASQSYEASEW